MIQNVTHQFNHIATPWFKPTNLKAKTLPNGLRFYYDPGDEPRIYWPSITTVLSDYKKKILDAWRKRVGPQEAERIASTARIRGDAFHTMCEKFIQNEKPEDFLPGFSSYHRRIFSQVRRILTKNVDNIHVQEQPLFSKTLGVAGRVDLIAEWNDIPSIIDFKGSNRMKKDAWIDNYKMQAAAYAFCYWEMTGIVINQVVIVISGDDFSVKPYICNPADWIDAFKKEKSKFMKTMEQKLLTK